jgi:predicted kinase
MADWNQADLVELHCEVPAQTAVARIMARTGNVSDADEIIATAMTEAQDPWTEATTIHTDQDVPDTLENALHAVRPHGAEHLWPLRPRMEAD